MNLEIPRVGWGMGLLLGLGWGRVTKERSRNGEGRMKGDGGCRQRQGKIYPFVWDVKITKMPCACIPVRIIMHTLLQIWQGYNLDMV